MEHTGEGRTQKLKGPGWRRWRSAKVWTGDSSQREFTAETGKANSVPEGKKGL